MQTVTPPKSVAPSDSKPPKKVSLSKNKLPKRRSNAPIALAVLLVVGLFAALSFVIATDDVAGMVSIIGVGGWGVVAAGGLLGLVVLVRRGKEVLGLGFISALALLAAGGAVVAFAPTFIGPAHYSQGQQAFNAQNYERAVSEFRQAGSTEYLKRDIPEAYLKWGDQLAKTGAYEGALAQYDKVVSEESLPNPFATQVPDARARVYLAWADKLDKENARASATLAAPQRAVLETDLLAKYEAVIAQNPAEGYANQARSGARNVLYRQAEEVKARNNYQELDALYQRISTKYLDGKSQAVSEVELRQANNFWQWSRQLSAETEYDQALERLKQAESRFVRYDPRKVDEITPDLVSNYSKLAPKLIQAGKYDEAVSRLEAAIRDYGAKDQANSMAKALVSSYVAFGSDLLDSRTNVGEARNKFKVAFDLNGKYKFNDTRPREGLGRTYLVQGQEAEQKNDFLQAINTYREGVKSTYFSSAEVITANNSVSRSYFSWAQQTDPNEFEKVLFVYREGLQTNGFTPTDRTRAIDAGGEVFLKQGTTAEQRRDLQGAVNFYAALAADPVFKNSAGARNLVNIAPKVMLPLAEQFITEAGTGDSQNTAKLVDARNLLQNIINTYGRSEQTGRAREILSAPVQVTGKLLNNQGAPVGTRPVQLADDWKLCTAATPDTDPDCQGRKEGVVAKGEFIPLLTAPDGGWSATLKPGKTYLVIWVQNGGKYTSAFNGSQPVPGVTIKVEPLLPIKYEYRTPTEALP